MDLKRFRRKYLLGLVTSPLTLYPVTVGVTLLAALGAFGSRAPWAWMGSAAGVLFGLGAFMQRLVTGCPRIADQAREEVERETQLQRNAALDDLDRELSVDRDPRDERALRDLRALSDAFVKGTAWRRDFDAQTLARVVETVEQIFDQCVTSLRLELALGRSAATAATPKVKKSILRKRDVIIENVRRNVDMLNQTLAGLEEKAEDKNHGAGLTQLSGQLTRQLELAKEVDQKMKSLGLDESWSEINLSKPSERQTPSADG